MPRTLLTLAVLSALGAPALAVSGTSVVGAATPTMTVQTTTAQTTTAPVSVTGACLSAKVPAARCTADTSWPAPAAWPDAQDTPVHAGGFGLSAGPAYPGGASLYVPLVLPDPQDAAAP